MLSFSIDFLKIATISCRNVIIQFTVCAQYVSSFQKMCAFPANNNISKCEYFIICQIRATLSTKKLLQDLMRFLNFLFIVKSVFHSQTFKHIDSALTATDIFLP